YAMAQREIALAIGEPPVTRGYPPSVFAKLPQIVERAGNANEGGGSITAFYTVLAEGDDQQDPVADCARAILDGHVVLSRTLSDAGHYPAIDIETSISRAMTSLISQEQFESVRRFRSLYSRYQRNRDLISVGAYAAGSDPRLDEALARSRSRKMFGHTLGDFQMTQAKLADMATGIEAGALLTYRAAWARDVQKRRITSEAAMAKMHATETAQQVIDAAVQIFGGLGVKKDHPVERLYREVRALRIYEGATEVQKVIIARELLKGSRTGG
ncbi:MAG: acyl-CoA dehydrogenase family protein, partial [Betaproteobacteria bacterium]